MQEDVGAVKEHEATLKTLYIETLEEFNTVLGALKVKPYKRTKAVLFQNIIVEKATEHFEAIQNVQVIPKYESAQFLFENGMVARFKKVNRELLSSNYPTARALSIIGQQGTLFPELTPITYIEIGYLPNAAWSSFDMLVVIKRENKNISLLFEIDLEGTSEVTIKSTPATPRIPEKEIQIKLINDKR